MGRPAGSKNKLTPKEINTGLSAAIKSDDIVVPSIKFEGDDKKHALQVLFDGDEENMPTLVSVGTVGVPGTNTWISFVMHSKGRKIIKIEAEEPNLRAIAEESAKIAFVNTFMGA